MKRFPKLLCSLGLLLGSQVAFLPVAHASGGDGYFESAFTPEHHVVPQELVAYAAGTLALEPAAYWRIYHFLAYRALTGHPVSQQELALLKIDRWTVGDTDSGLYAADDPQRNGVAAWLAARGAVGAADVKVEATTQSTDYTLILNCHRDAFAKAAQTLQQRYKALGKTWGGVWLANQDAVFANCSPPASPGGGKPGAERVLTLPPALPGSAPDVLVKDRAYQSASALFYSGRYDSARAAFQDIAKDAKSPWQPLGQYLAARCLLRKASLSTAEPGSKEVLGLLATARGELQALPAEQAESMIHWVDARLRPDERRQELANQLAKGTIDGNTWQPITDYLTLLDRIEGQPMIRAKDPMTAWIGVMQAGYFIPLIGEKDTRPQTRKLALEVARAHWAAAHELHWLVAILANVLPDELTAPEQKAAAEVSDASPAFGQLQFHLARVALARKKFDDAQTITNAMLKRPLQASVRNRWLRLKMASAKTAEDFFAAAIRTVVEDQGMAPIPNEGYVDAQQGAHLDFDYLDHLASHFSLSDLLQYKSKVVASEQKWVAEMIWTRAVILGKFDIADAVTDDLKKGRETTHYLYDAFRKASTPEQKKSAAMLILANTPELNPYVRAPGAPPYGGTYYYWSCTIHHEPIDEFGDSAPPFLAEDQRKAARSEIEQLLQVPVRSVFLIPRVMDWARNNKANADGPKALHFLVASTRNECWAGAADPNAKDKGKAHNYSKEAFQFLHSQYPRSEWTAATKYYY